MTTQQYLDNIAQRFKLGNATEHTFRGDLQQYIESLVPDVRATNEPKRIKCGAPDYVLTRKDIPVAYIEAKDIDDKDLEGNKKTGNKEQFDRYKASLNNLAFTDYLQFMFYRDGVLTHTIRIGEVRDGKVIALPQHFAEFEHAIRNFTSVVTQSIKSPTRLAEMMAEKAKFLANQIEKALDSDEASVQNSELKAQYKAFQDTLVRDLSHQGFADMYAQTIAYGMFAARYHDPTLHNFSRQEAAELIPHSNPFLRKLFQSIAGYDLDKRIDYIVDDLVQLFLASDVKDIMQNFGKSTQQEDPVIHFYETFLAKYDPALRKARGVWYTPQPVVNFIVRAVDDILKSEFDLPQGLADTSKTKIKVDLQGKKIEQEVHKVQVLDPATGTGTFLAEIVNHIYKRFEGQQGIWRNYVEKHLLPRLNGFELLMTSYAMAHLKLDILLSEKGFKNESNQRFRIFLTNSLEESHPDTGTLFAHWLAQEANEANTIKRDTPVMCVIGNPPYSVSSNNKSEWIESLTADYKKDLNERNIQSLSDDYIKFIRFGQHFIDKNGSGVLAYISNNSFIDGIIHRQMRKHLLESFDTIYILDLHGNAKKKETAEDGSTDQNVFDIMQGVSINIFVKTGKKKRNQLGKVYHFDLQGKRNFKYDFLDANSLKGITWNELEYSAPNYYFVKKDFEGGNLYSNGFKIDSLFLVNNTGIETGRDDFFIDWDKSTLSKKVSSIFENKDNSSLFEQYNITNTSSFRFKDKIVASSFSEQKIIPIAYRPFDIRYTYYDYNLQRRASYNTLKNIILNNRGLIIGRQGQAVGSMPWNVVTIANTLVDCNIFYRGRGTVFPLYLYPETSGQLEIGGTTERQPNLNKEIVAVMAKGLGLRFTAEKEQDSATFAPIDILDYIYAVLHSPTYRETYKEFLKIDFPRVPYPSADKFWALVKLGGELRQLHLLESPTVERYITQYPEDGDNLVTKPKYQDGKVYINDTQYFANVPDVAWNFYIGGYQPAQKWLKDRKDRHLEFDDILHYQKVIVALTETARLMAAIDEVGVM